VVGAEVGARFVSALSPLAEQFVHGVDKIRGDAGRVQCVMVVSRRGVNVANRSVYR
jgi:hypothetical protein